MDIQHGARSGRTWLKDKGVITPVAEPTGWVSSTVAANKKQTDNIRIYINPRDLKLSMRPHHPMRRTVVEVASQMFIQRGNS